MQIRAQSVRHGLLPLILVLDQCPLIVRQVREKSEASDTIGGDPVTVNDSGAIEELAQIVPVKVPSILEFLDQARRIEGVPRLPEFQHHEAPDQSLIERARREYAEVVDVARLVALIAGADFLSRGFQDNARQTISAGTKGSSLK